MSDVLCTRCKACMCDDCQSMVGEYVTLFENWRHRAAVLEHQAKKAVEERDAALRREEHFKTVALSGLDEIIKAWLMSMDIERIDRILQSQKEWETAVAAIDAATASLDWRLAKEIREKLEW